MFLTSVGSFIKDKVKEPKVKEPKVKAKVKEPKVKPKVKAKVEPKVEPKVKAKVEAKVKEPKVEPKVKAKVKEPKVKEPKVTVKANEMVGANVKAKVEGIDWISYIHTFLKIVILVYLIYIYGGYYDKITNKDTKKLYMMTPYILITVHFIWTFYIGAFIKKKIGWLFWDKLKNILFPSDNADRGTYVFIFLLLFILHMLWVIFTFEKSGNKCKTGVKQGCNRPWLFYGPLTSSNSEELSYSDYLWDITKWFAPTQEVDTHYKCSMCPKNLSPTPSISCIGHGPKSPNRGCRRCNQNETWYSFKDIDASIKFNKLTGTQKKVLQVTNFKQDMNNNIISASEFANNKELIGQLKQAKTSKLKDIEKYGMCLPDEDDESFGEKYKDNYGYKDCSQNITRAAKIECHKNAEHKIKVTWPKKDKQRKDSHVLPNQIITFPVRYPDKQGKEISGLGIQFKIPQYNENDDDPAKDYLPYHNKICYNDTGGSTCSIEIPFNEKPPIQKGKANRVGQYCHKKAGNDWCVAAKPCSEINDKLSDFNKKHTSKKSLEANRDKNYSEIFIEEKKEDDWMNILHRVNEDCQSHPKCYMNDFICKTKISNNIIPLVDEYNKILVPQGLYTDKGCKNVLNTCLKVKEPCDNAMMIDPGGRIYNGKGKCMNVKWSSGKWIKNDSKQSKDLRCVPKKSTKLTGDMLPLAEKGFKDFICKTKISNNIIPLVDEYNKILVPQGLYTDKGCKNVLNTCLKVKEPCDNAMMIDPGGRIYNGKGKCMNVKWSSGKWIKNDSKQSKDLRCVPKKSTNLTGDMLPLAEKGFKEFNPSKDTKLPENLCQKVSQLNMTWQIVK